MVSARARSREPTARPRATSIAPAVRAACPGRAPRSRTAPLRRAARGRGGGRPPGRARAWPPAYRRAAVPRTADSSGLQESPKHLIPGGHEGPGHAAGEVGDRAAIDVEPGGRGRLVAEPQQGGGPALTGRPAPVQRRVVAGERLERGSEAAEREHLTLALGAVHRGPGRVKAGAVHLGGRGREGRSNRSPAPGHDPIDAVAPGPQ